MSVKAFIAWLLAERCRMCGSLDAPYSQRAVSGDEVRLCCACNRRSVLVDRATDLDPRPFPELAKERAA